MTTKVIVIDAAVSTPRWTFVSLSKEEFDSVASHSIIIIGTSRWINQRRINIEIGRYKMKRFREPLYVK